MNNNKKTYKTKQALIGHTIRRVKERLGIKLTETKILEFNKQIQNGGGEVEFVKKVSDRRSLWKTQLDGVEIILAYDKERHTVATILLIMTPEQKKERKILKRQCIRKVKRAKKRTNREDENIFKKKIEYCKQKIRKIKTRRKESKLLREEIKTKGITNNE